MAGVLGAVKVTVAPDTKLPKESTTVAINTRPNFVFTVAFCGVPPVAVMEAGVPAEFVSEKIAEVEIPDTAARMLYPPAVVLAVTATDVACPIEFVTAVVLNAPPKLALAPVPGAVNVTVTPWTGVPKESVTVAISRFVKAVLTVALWPPVAAVTL